jgi:hypothetical protein
MFIPLVSDDATTVVKKNTSVNNNNSNANFYDIYAQKLLNSSLDPALKQLTDNSDYNDDTSSTIEAMPMNINNINNQINPLPNMNNTSDSISLFTALIGKKISYVDPQSGEVKEGIVKNMIINEKLLPCLQLDDNSIVRFERQVTQ